MCIRDRPQAGLAASRRSRVDRVRLRMGRFL
jgi:hypothetical protein